MARVPLQDETTMPQEAAPANTLPRVEVVGTTPLPGLGTPLRDVPAWVPEAFTAFTDGATTWVNGPNGLQSRPNGVRFSWERDPIQPSGAAFSPATGGGTAGEGDVVHTRMAADCLPRLSPPATCPASRAVISRSSKSR